MHKFISHQEVWRLAWPMILSGLTVPLVGMVDTAVMGRLPTADYIGGVALGTLVFSYVFFGFGFLRMGTTGLAAQALGAGDTAALNQLFAKACVLAVSLSALLYAVHVPMRLLAFEWLQGSANVEALGVEYFNIRLYGIPAVLLRMVMVGWLLGVQNSRYPLYILLLTNSLNMVLDVMLVLLLQWDVAGVAWATVVAEYAGVILGAVLCCKAGIKWSMIDVSRLSHWREYLPMFKLNSDIFIRTLMLISCFSYFTAQGAKQGEAVLAANAVLMNFMMFLAFGMDGLAHAAEALVGKSVGSGDAVRLKQAIRITGIWSLGFAIAYSVAYGFAGEWMIHSLTTIAEVRELAEEYLPWLVVLPLLASAGFWLDGVFIGATWSRDMRNMMAVSCSVYLLIWWLTQSLGNHGLWLALAVWFVMRGLTLAAVLPKRFGQFITPSIE